MFVVTAFEGDVCVIAVFTAPAGFDDVSAGVYDDVSEMVDVSGVFHIRNDFDILSALKDGDSPVLTYLAKVNLRLTGTPG